MILSCYYSSLYLYLEKPGKSKFAPSIGGRKAGTAAGGPTTTTATAPSTTATVQQQNNILESEEDLNKTNTNTSSSGIEITTAKEIEEEGFDIEVESEEMPSIISGKRIESIQSRRQAAASVHSSDHHTTTPHISTSTSTSTTNNNLTSIRLPEGPKDAASIASSAQVPEKRTMAYFLKDSGEGREMPTFNDTSSSAQTTTAASSNGMSPTKTRRIVNLKNIKAPRSTTTALAPQVRIVDGAIIYDETVTAAVTIPGITDDLEQQLEYVDDDDENGNHLTSATYSKRSGSNRWNRIETDFFYEALSMFGTDFSMIQTIFPRRSRAQIKGKYKLEERANGIKISAALKNKIAFDPTFKDRVKEALPEK